MKRITSAITTKLLAVALLLLMLGFTPAFGQVNPLQPASKPALKKPVHAPSAVHRRKHRRHRRRRIRRTRRHHRRALRRHHVPVNGQNNQQTVAH